jgi:glutathione synthase/RimK-type ligase-like ATP-grasp enzyme
MIAPRVLLLSGLYDFSTDLVAAELAEKEVPFVRLNREQLSDCRLTLDPVAAILEVRTSSLSLNISADDLSSVLFRQPVFLRNTPGRALSLAEQLERSQWPALLRGLCVFDKARWMNHPAKTYLAESKPYQLHVASRLGFDVPSTRIGNDLRGIESAKLGNPLILKSVDTVLLRDGSDSVFTFSTIGHVDEWRDEDLYGAPVMCQKLIRHKTDLRVTIVGDAIFAARIQENGHGIEGDWRIRPRGEIQFVPAELPTDCATLCRRLAATLGLPFAAIDLAEVEDGRIFFLEVNPTGEWGWLVGHGLRIDAAIADWLAQ